MDELKKNKPAFPTHDADSGTDPRSRILTGGMSLRDYFAGQAIVALPHMGCGADLFHEDFAAAAYQLADALLAERARHG